MTRAWAMRPPRPGRGWWRWRPGPIRGYEDAVPEVTIGWSRHALAISLSICDRGDGVPGRSHHAWEACPVRWLDRAAGAGGPAAAQGGKAPRAARAGRLPGSRTVEVPCHSPYAERWFDVLVSTRRDDDGRSVGATVTLSLTRAQTRVLLPAGRGAPGQTAASPLSGRHQSAAPRDRLGHVYWIGGGSEAGKSTIARRL